jgi:hypothetical protein
VGRNPTTPQRHHPATKNRQRQQHTEAKNQATINLLEIQALMLMALNLPAIREALSRHREVSNISKPKRDPGKRFRNLRRSWDGWAAAEDPTLYRTSRGWGPAPRQVASQGIGPKA